jgi:hypothetical protein
MLKILDPASFQLSTARRLRPDPVSGLSAEVGGDSRCRRRFCGIDPRLPVTPFFSALPYDSCVTPLSTAFTHFDAGGRGRIPDGSAGPGLSGHSSSSNLQTCRPSDLSTLFFSTVCRLLCLSLSPTGTSKHLFSAIYRHFSADTGGGGCVFHSAHRQLFSPGDAKNDLPALFVKARPQ